MRFKPGQEVVCTNPHNYWWNTDKNIPSDGPKFNEIVTVDRYDGDLYFYPNEYPKDSYLETAFEPVVSSEAIKEVMKSLKQPFEV